MSSPTSHSPRRRRQQERSTTSRVATAAATAAVAYGTYRLAQWYWKEDDDSEEEGTEQREQQQQQQACPPPFSSSTNNYHNHPSDSWISTALTGAACWWLTSGETKTTSTTAAPTSSRHGSKPKRQPQTRRQQLSMCRYQTKVAFRTCFATLQPAIENLTDTSKPTKELKALRRRQKEKNGNSNENDPPQKMATQTNTEEDFWREILVESSTRMVVSSYAYTLLFLSLTVQFHWLAAASSSVGENDGDCRRPEQQEAMLIQTHQYFLHQGLPLLVSTIRRAVKQVLFEDDDDECDDTEEKKGAALPPSWRNPSTYFVTRGEIEESLYQNLPRVLDAVGIGRRRRNWIRFVLPDQEEFDPLWDICRSPVWEDAQEQVLGSLWHQDLRDGGGGWGKLFAAGDGCEKQPLVKVLPRFKKAASCLFEKDHDGDYSSPIMERLQTLPTVLELGDITLQ